MIRRDILIILAVTLAVYANSLSNGLAYDDHFLIEGNRQVRAFDLRGIFTTHYWGGYEGNETGQYRPLVILSFALNFALHGLRPFGYHLTNVLLHALNSVLVYLLAISVMGGRPSPRQAAPPSTCRSREVATHLPTPLPHVGEGKTSVASRGEGCGSGFVALAAGLLFAVHPVHAEAAAGVTFGRADLLAALFTFGALLFYIQETSPPDPLSQRERGKEKPAPPSPLGKGDGGLGLLSLLCFALALLCKESAVALIGLAALYDVSASEEAGARGAIAGTLRRRWRVYAIYVAIFLAYLLVRAGLGIGFSAGSPSRLNNPLFGEPLLHRLWTAAKLVFLYAGLVVLPLRLSVDYSYNAIPVAVSWLEPEVLLGGGVALLCAVVWLWSFSRWREGFFAVGFLLIAYAPVSQTVALVNALFQERFFYAPLFGVCLLVGSLLRRLRGRDVAAATLAALVVLYAARTVVRNRDWKDDYMLFASAADACPNSVKAQGLLGDALAERGLLNRAVASYREALRLASPIPSDVANVYNNLGNVYQLQGRLDAAIDAYRQAVSLQPDYAAAFKSMGVVYLKKGGGDEAAACFEKVIALRPDDAEAHYNLGLSCQGAGRPEDAIRHYERAVALRPGYAEAHYNLGNVYRDRGMTSAAVKAYRKFVEVWRGDEGVREMARREIEALETSPTP
ncbi:MAG: hypothetical protein A3F84_15945 [Candidatus Handelsmanbacteria bacterium RIFCSPLOWO2_12_FULL_64_10]|uniref:Uncharacterized protein n=1 Tax=Handelsmanbacteria sp. (strain RIFCSPLOWO2_12_FULL_64_10) TaxID=1817868 RepID=A0A1F6CAS7_HANXR|nr:MAG: hypothetical protein A3F84_15945 [Candidatus Handelsmanbacteria bacterium RIFCSPLOWO2_12_FULL_64_10]